MKKLFIFLLCAGLLMSCAAGQKRTADEGITISINAARSDASRRIADFLKAEGYAIEHVNPATGYIETRPRRSTYEPVIRKISTIESQFMSAAEMSLWGPLMCTTVIKAAAPQPGKLLIKASIYKDNLELDFLRSAKLTDYYAREIARILK